MIPTQTAAPPAAAGPPQNMYANLLAGYQSAAQANYGQQIANSNRNQQAMQGEMFRQQQQLNKQNKFWNRLKNGFTSGLVNFAGQLPSMAMKAGMTALGGPVGGLLGSQAPANTPDPSTEQFGGGPPAPPGYGNGGWG
jgi:hypothetical protein